MAHLMGGDTGRGHTRHAVNVRAEAQDAGARVVVVAQKALCLFDAHVVEALVIEQVAGDLRAGQVTGCAHLGVFLERPLNAHLRPQTQ